MNWFHFTLFIVIIFAGSIIQSMSGFGFSIFAQAFFPYFMPSVSTGVAITGLLSGSSSAYPVWKLRKHIKFKRVLVPLITYVLFSTFVITWFAAKPDILVNKLLGAALILMSLYFIFARGKIKVRPNVASGLLVGALSGVFSGLFSIGGPPVVLYMLAICENSDEYYANTQAFFVCTCVYSFLVRLYSGIINMFVIWHFLIGSFVVLGGSYLGRSLLRRVKAEKIVYFVYAVMILSGIMMIIAG